MADNQRKKQRGIITPEQKKQRKEINNLIYKATGKRITPLAKEKWPTNKSIYYDNVVKMPLPPDFIDLIKETFNVDLSDFSRIKEPETKIVDPTLSHDYLLRENIVLLRKLREYEQKEGIDLDKVVELKRKIDELTELLNKKLG
jgi:hypothetical protein